MLESTLQRGQARRARALGVVGYKFSSDARRHVPDYIYLYQGRVYFVEYKQLGKRPSRAQHREHEIFRALGFVVDVIDNPVYGSHRMDMFIRDALAL